MQQDKSEQLYRLSHYRHNKSIDCFRKKAIFFSCEKQKSFHFNKKKTVNLLFVLLSDEMFAHIKTKTHTISMFHKW